MALSQDFINALPAMNQAAVDTGSDYKALVCVFFNGGMDHVNAVPPLGAQYAQYATDRAGFATPQANILTLTGSPMVGLNPALTGIQSLYNSGSASIICNVGPLVEPMDKLDYTSGTGQRPYQIFSHSDQQNVWYTERPDRPGEPTGWFGRAADLISAAFNSSATVPPNLSVSGRSRILEANEVAPYQIRATNGLYVTPTFAREDGQGSPLIIDGSLLDRVNDNWKTRGRTNKLEQSISYIADNTIGLADTVRVAAGTQTMNVTFPETSLGNQLRSVARMIRGRSTLGHRRQMFFVSLGGFDTHSAPFESVNTSLLSQVNAAVLAFYNEMIAQGVSSDVTVFTASDFGRCLVPNNGGTDHGWGGHHFIIGDGINGGRLFNRDAKNGAILNTYPTVTVGGPWDIGQGRLVPQISVAEYGATLMKWMGVPDATNNGVNPMDLIFPNLSNFASRDLGFFS